MSTTSTWVMESNVMGKYREAHMPVWLQQRSKWQRSVIGIFVLITSPVWVVLAVIEDMGKDIALGYRELFSLIFHTYKEDDDGTG